MRNSQQTLFVEQVPAAIAMFDTEMRYIAVSRRYLSLLEFSGSPEEIIGRSHYETFPDMPSQWRENHARVLAGKELADTETPFPRRDGRIDWVRWSMKPWYAAEGEIGGALMAIELITDQVEAKHALTKSEARFRATFENAAVGITHLDPNLRYLRANKALSGIVGWPLDEFVTKAVDDVTHPDDVADDLAHIERMLQGKIDSHDFEKRYLGKDGSIRWARVTTSCVRRSDGSVDYFVRVVQDVSDRKRAEEELRESEERFRSTLLHSPVPVMLFDDREDIVAVSQSWLDETGYSKEELRRMEDWTARAYHERSDEVLTDIRRTISKKPQTKRIEELLHTKDDRERLWNFVTAPLGILPNGRHLFISVAQDLTERKAHEEHVQLLMREAYHRVKNLLGLVQVMARQTAAGDPDDFIERFTERVQALAANQDLLGRKQQLGADLEALVRAQLSHLADLVESRIAVRGPKLHLNAAAVQAIGLALHELATNASKYGALSTDAGRVDIGWRADGDTFAMSWLESNGPPVQPPGHRGFGTTVIESMAKLAIDGEVQLDYVPSGLEWHLSCPAANVLDHRRV